MLGVVVAFKVGSAVFHVWMQNAIHDPTTFSDVSRFAAYEGILVLGKRAFQDFTQLLA